MRFGKEDSFDNSITFFPEVFVSNLIYNTKIHCSNKREFPFSYLNRNRNKRTNQERNGTLILYHSMVYHRNSNFLFSYFFFFNLINLLVMICWNKRAGPALSRAVELKSPLGRNKKIKNKSIYYDGRFQALFFIIM